MFTNCACKSKCYGTQEDIAESNDPIVYLCTYKYKGDSTNEVKVKELLLKDQFLSWYKQL